MKKKLMAVLAAGLLLVGTVSVASAITFNSTTNLNMVLSGTGTTAWTQAMPGDFQMPFDTINSATLSIFSNYVDGNNDRISVENTYVGNLVNDGTTGLMRLIFDPLDSTGPLNVAALITAPWATGAAIDISLAYDERRDGLIYLDSSVLTLNYNNVSAPVPEPGTMVLLGAGLLGLAVFGKRRMKTA